MLIDFHTHCFPDKLSERAIFTLSENIGKNFAKTDGTLTGLSELSKSDTVDYAVVLNIATNPKQQKNVIDFAISINNINNVISFASVHPFAENALEELERIKESGIKGIKLHPDYQGFFVNDEKVFKVYEKISQLNLITTFHTGVDLGMFEPVHCSPKALSEVLPIFKGSPVIAAHFGGYASWYETEEHLVGKNIYFDTSFSYGRIAIAQAKRIIKNHTADKILFGSDLPWSTAGFEKGLIEMCNLSKEENEKIFYLNAKKLLNI